MKEGLTTVIKSGTARSKDGAEKDRGTIVHIIEKRPEGIASGGYWSGKALCGIKPGKRSNGWYEVSQSATCEKCISKNNNKMAKQIDLAEQQLLGFSHAKQGYDLISLVESMGLTKTEWEKLKKDYGLEYLTEAEKQEIDSFFEKKS